MRAFLGSVHHAAHERLEHRAGRAVDRRAFVRWAIAAAAVAATLGGAGRGTITVATATWVDQDTARFTFSGTWGTGPVTVQMTHTGTAEGGNELFSATTPLPMAGPVGYTVRILPHHPLLAGDNELGLVTLA